MYSPATGGGTVRKPLETQPRNGLPNITPVTRSKATGGLFRPLGGCGSTSTTGRSLTATKVMQSSRISAMFKHVWVVLVLVLAQAGSLWAQQAPFLAALKVDAIEPAPVPFVAVTYPESRPHRFWDNENRVLFAGVAALSAADFAVTRANLASNGRELNPVTRVFSGSTAGLAVNFSLETAGVIGVSYVLHRTGHHKLERMVSMFNIGASGAAVGYDLAHR
jgi:hypothetical protein